MLFLYVRHGEPIYEPDSLTEQGHAQAEALSKRLCIHGLDEVYSSTFAAGVQRTDREADGYVYPKLMQLSGDGHLYKEGLSTLYNYDIEL